MVPGRVLIVEDSRTVAALLARQLRSAGIDCDVVDTVAAGREALARGEHELVLLDLFLPDAEGLDGLAAVRAVDPAVAVVILTSHDDSATAQEAVQAGAQDYLIKGQAEGLLLRKLAFAWERNRVRAELDAMAAELREKNAQLEEANRLKNVFLGMAAHDLRNPLGVVMGLAELTLEVGGLDEDQTTSLQHIRRSSLFMRDLVDDLLDLTAIESGQLDLNRGEWDLAAFLAERVEAAHRLAGPKDIALSLDAPPGGVRAEFDKRRLSQVVDNLLSNAIKFSPRSSRVRVRLSEDADGSVVAVEDEGQGIPADELDRLFRPFGRTSVRATDGEKSTGLGLAIVRKVIEAHGGAITCRSEVGVGTTFVFRLPPSGARRGC